MSSSASDAGGLTLRELDARRVAELKAVGDKLRSGLAEMGIDTVLDLLEHYPRRYVDRTERAEIHELEIGQEATVDAEVRSIHARRTRDRKRTIVNATVYDGTGLLEIVFFNQAWRERQLRPGTQVSLFGKVDSYRGKRQMTNPVVDVLADPEAASDVTGAIVPVYPQSGKAEVHTWQLRRVVASCLQRTEARGFADPLDASLRRDPRPRRPRPRLPRHPPPRDDDRPRARRRSASSSTSSCACSSHWSRASARSRPRRPASSTSVDGPLVPAFHAALPFPLTDDQAAAIAQITADMAKPAPMHRLLQGEVGSGKTIVALTALLTAVQGGYQGAFMAPTEVLAEQHELTMRSLLAGLTVHEAGSLLGERPVSVALLTNRTSAAERRRIADGLRAGTVDILVGTHALIYGGRGVRAPRRRGDRRAAPLRGRAARPAAREGRCARRSGHDGDAHPAHRGDAHLRRPRQDGATSPAGRAFADRRPTVVGGGPLERVAVVREGA